MKLPPWLTLCDDERRVALRPLCKAGLTDREIADQFGTAKGSISHFLSVKARDLQALRRQSAADRLEGVVADARAAATKAAAPTLEPDVVVERLTALDASVAALSATVGEVLDVVRGIAARMEERALVVPEQPAAATPVDDEDGPWMFGPGGWRPAGERLVSPEPASDHAENYSGPASNPVEKFNTPPSAPHNRGGRKPVWAGESINTIRRLAVDGRTDGEIAEALGDRTHWTVAKLRQRYRIPAGRPLVTPTSIWTEDRIAELRRLAGEGMGDAAIAETLGLEVTPSAIRQARTKHGIKAGGRQGGGRAWSEEAIDEVRKLATEGLSSREITARLGKGHSRSAIIGLCQRLGIKLGQPLGGQRKALIAPPVARVAEKSSPAPRRPGNVVPLRRAADAPRSLPRAAPAARPKRPGTMPALVAGTPVGILPVKAQQCRWPVADDPTVTGGYLFCAADTGDITASYCPHHRWRSVQSRGEAAGGEAA